MPGTKPLVQIKNINKFYGENHVVKDLSIDVQEGEFLTILGSSGSGKSTTLRMVAGFEQPTTGEILLAGTNVADKEPFERDVNTVFQSYALFPHMTIFDNVAYGLKLRKLPEAACQYYRLINKLCKSYCCFLVIGSVCFGVELPPVTAYLYSINSYSCCFSAHFKKILHGNSSGNFIG